MLSSREVKTELQKLEQIDLVTIMPSQIRDCIAVVEYSHCAVITLKNLEDR